MFSPFPSPIRQTALAPKLLLPGVVGVVALAAVIGWISHGSSADRPLSAAEQVARTVSFNQATPVVLVPVLAKERVSALQTMKLPADAQAKFEQQKNELAWLTLWDDRDEDGDVVTVSSGGFSQTVTLQNAPVRIAIPRPPAGIITITGSYDGGGGITVALAHLIHRAVASGAFRVAGARDRASVSTRVEQDCLVGV